MSVMHHPEWTMLQWCLTLEYVGRDPRPGDVPRFRIEVRTDLPEMLIAHLLTLRSPCVNCGAPMTPIRKRAHGGLFFGATCRDALHGNCSKGTAAREEYCRIHDALLVLAKGQPPAASPAPAQPTLF